ncbi:MAG: stage 0 sporulation protein [Desulfobacterales bacterium]|jgi:cell fate regulator YaaT (PSP1 superfamily)|nr:stage 0 sporulation protein [Desulfobacteraceae bacterium]MBT4365253.1 stage 0 sporulation protein [Desulfobacteraceae bacterium]MBT7084683.1 stage 0 sporulation protein [Desulfobacterales bacterium]MBT7697491.1 stage 0 sporulation protein [Desulfobacterales bacterium]
MVKVVGIRFKPAGKIYDFDCGAFVLELGDDVIVETDQGLSFGFVVTPQVPVEKVNLKKALKKVYRLANQDDLLQREKNTELEKKAHDYCLECIKELKLEMNLFFVESIFDASKLTFFFTAEGRVDFRQLVKMLVNKYRVKIEMRQVGIRNQAKMCGGMGRCGREICCSAFMGKFEPVSIRMAKNQGLSLNPTKISGQCGRLMCCLTFENKTYQHLKDKAPKVGKKVDTERGKGKVVRHNLISNKISVKLEDGVEAEIDLSEIITRK